MSGISLENRLAIYELLAEYSHHVDNYRGEEWAALFVEGARLECAPLEDVVAPEGIIKQARFLKKSRWEYRHSMTNVYLEPDSDDERATVNAYGLVTDWATKPAQAALFVEYRFDLVKQDGRWKIAHERVHAPYGL